MAKKPFNKARSLRVKFNAKKIARPESFDSIPQGVKLVIVIHHPNYEELRKIDTENDFNLYTLENTYVYKEYFLVEDSGELLNEM